MNYLTKCFTLSNGIKIPQIGLGTWQVNNDDVKSQIKTALQNGYLHIDSASAYGNEEGVGIAVRQMGIDRHKLFITTKVPAEIKTKEGAIKIIEESLRKLNLDYIDLLLIHAPKPWSEMGDATSNRYEKENIEVWKVLIDYYQQGKVKSIGVSNFNIEDLKNLISATKVVPMVNQIKACIGDYPFELIKFCEENNIIVEAYSPISTGKLLTHQKLLALAKKYHVSVAQLAIRYIIQKDLVVLPKARGEKHIIENTKLDFVISPKDMKILDTI